MKHSTKVDEVEEMHVCLTCGRSYKPYRSNQLYCSKICHAKHHYTSTATKYTAEELEYFRKRSLENTITYYRNELIRFVNSGGPIPLRGSTRRQLVDAELITPAWRSGWSPTSKLRELLNNGQGVDRKMNGLAPRGHLETAPQGRSAPLPASGGPSNMEEARTKNE